MLILILTYIAVLVFLYFNIRYGYKIASAPVHLRWELYPVPHEKGRSHYGGSVLEEVDWWTKPREKDKIGELKIMIPEILFLKAIWEHNRPLWLGSFAFHWGLYILIGNMFLLILSAILGFFGYTISDQQGGILAVLYYLIYWLPIVGSIIGIIGGIRLFMQRIVDADLRLYSTASHYFNIILISFIYISLLWWALSDKNFVSNAIGFYTALFTFGKLNEIPTIAYIHIYTTLFFMIYLPFTHMTHFFSKYFTYHKVRWEDEPNQPKSKIAQKVSEYLNYPVTWAAPHIGADGRKNWIAIASTFPGKEKQDEK